MIGAVAVLISAFLLGGSSRGDIMSLLLLRPLAIILLGTALWDIRADDVRRNLFLCSMAILIVLVPVVQLIPLPAQLWGQLPNHELIIAIDREAGLGNIWRPLSVVPSGTWNALFSLAVPLALLVFAIRLDQRQREALLSITLILGLASALLGLLQILGPEDSPLYFYRITHNGSAVGLFANRNHQAALLACLFPMLAVYASLRGKPPSSSKRRTWSALIVALCLIPLILITGSRAGLISGSIGLVLGALIYRPHRGNGTSRAKPYNYAAVAAGVAALIGVTIVMGRAEAFNRIAQLDASDEFRWRAWSPVFDLAWKYFPAGSGMGSFADVYKAGEPASLLHPTYFNQAHNDWLEVMLIAGAPGIMLLLAAVAATIWRFVGILRDRKTSSPDNHLACLGLSTIVILAFASITDYPLRVPSIACLFVIAVVWAAHGRVVKAEVGDAQIGSGNIRSRVS